MIDLVYKTGCKTDLVTVGGVARRRAGYDLTLGKLALEGFGNGLCGVSRTGYAHCGVNVASARKRVTDRAADAGCRTAEGLDLGGMVVSFVLEEEKPILLLAVNGDLDLDCASVDLFALVKVTELTRGLEIFSGKSTDVHQRHGLGSAKLLADADIVIVCLLKELILEGYGVDLGEEGGVTAVVGPICIDHADLGDRGVAAFGLEVILTEGDVVDVHCEGVVGNERLKSRAVEGGEAFKDLYVSGNGIFCREGLEGIESRFAGFNGVDEEFGDLGKLGVRNIAVDRVDLCGANSGTVAAGDQLNALRRGVRSLVELTGEKFGSENARAREIDLCGSIVHLGLGENCLNAVVKELFGDAFAVVAIDLTNRFYTRNTEKLAELTCKSARLVVKTGLFFNVNSVNHFIDLS